VVTSEQAEAYVKQHPDIVFYSETSGLVHAWHPVIPHNVSQGSQNS